MDLDLQDRVYVVTGGGRGLGRAVTGQLVSEGARVVVSGRSNDTLQRVADELGDAVRTVVADNADPVTPAALVGVARQAWGRLDGVLISVGGPPTGSVVETSDEHWTSSFETVFLGALRVARAVAAELDEGGSITFVLSSSVRSPLPDMAISNGLRPGLAMVAKTLSDEVAPRGIRVNGLLPGRIETERIQELEATNDDPAEARARSMATIPMGRYGEPAEFGRAAAFLMSPASSFITGVMLPVDGGMLRTL